MLRQKVLEKPLVECIMGAREAFEFLGGDAGDDINRFALSASHARFLLVLAIVDNLVGAGYSP